MKSGSVDCSVLDCSSVCGRSGSSSCERKSLAIHLSCLLLLPLTMSLWLTFPHSFMPQVVPIPLLVAIGFFYFSWQTKEGKPKEWGVFFSFSLGSWCGDSFSFLLNSKGCAITKLKKGKLYQKPLSWWIFRSSAFSSWTQTGLWSSKRGKVKHMADQMLGWSDKHAFSFLPWTKSSFSSVIFSGLFQRT